MRPFESMAHGWKSGQVKVKNWSKQTNLSLNLASSFLNRCMKNDPWTVLNHWSNVEVLSSRKTASGEPGSLLAVFHRTILQLWFIPNRNRYQSDIHWVHVSANNHWAIIQWLWPLENMSNMYITQYPANDMGEEKSTIYANVFDIFTQRFLFDFLLLGFCVSLRKKRFSIKC